MAVYVADAQGAIDKAVGTIAVADAQGAIDKEVQTGYVAHIAGSITKQFYANWVLMTGTILNSASGGGYLSSVASLTPVAKSFDIKPVHIEASALIQASEAGQTATVKLEVEYMDASSNWVSLKTTNKSVADSYQTISLNFDVTEEIITRQLRYRLILLSSSTANFSTFTGKCTEWWQKG